MRTIGILSRLEERVDIRHEAGRSIAGVGCKRLDPILRYADVIQPLAADLLAGTVTHCLLHIVALCACIQSIQPYKDRIFILRVELRLTVDGP